MITISPTSAIRNRYRPTFYIVDPEANIQGISSGEVHGGDRPGHAIAKLVETLLTDPSVGWQ